MNDFQRVYVCMFMIYKVNESSNFIKENQANLPFSPEQALIFAGTAAMTND